ncbi:MAG: hypothetical protein ASARMPREDX12_002249 [Alectoria sarmentosa]|nr:MAG: hypothetical protein ASARMPREDX12_002249 [Alectoria sarmentosa]
MDDSTAIEPRTKEPPEMDEQGFMSSDVYQADFDAESQSESPERSASGRWHTTNSSNTMELERHLSASSVSREARPSNVSNKRYDSREQLETAALMPGQIPGQVFGENGSHSNVEGRYYSSERSQSGNMISTSLLDPTLMDPRVSRGSDHRGPSEQQEPTNFIPAANINQTYDDIRASSSSNQRRGSSERLDPAHLSSAPGVERRGRSLSPRPKVSAETKARWAMLRQLAGVSQPHDVEEEDGNERRDEERRTTEVEVRTRQEASVGESSQTGDHADDASIERYLQKLQGDPHIDSRGLREGLSRMHSYKGPKGQQDQYLANESRFEGDTHSDALILSGDTRNCGVDNEMRRGEHDAGDMFHRGKGEAEQALRGSEVDLRRNEHVLGAGLERAGRRVEGELRSASPDARYHLQKDKQGFERDVRRNANFADAEMHKLGGQTARDFRSGEHGLHAGLQGAAHAAEKLLPHTNSRQDLQQGEHDLIGDVHKTENAFSRTGLGQEIRRGEDDLMGEVYKLEHEFPHTGMGQETRKGEAKVMGDIRKVENEMANTGLGQEIRKAEHDLQDEFHRLEHELPHLGLGQDLQKGEHDLKQGLHEAAVYLRRDEHALGRGAEAAGRSVEHGAEHIGKFAVEGAAIAVGLGMMALDHPGSGNRASSPESNVSRPGHGMIDQRMPSNTHQPGAGGPHPPAAPGPHPAPNVQRLNQPPAKHENRPSMVEPLHHAPIPQMLHPGHNQQPNSPGPATNKSLPGRIPSPSPETNQRSQMPVRKPVLPPRPQRSPQQRPPNAIPPHPQSQHPQAGPQHLPHVQSPQNIPQHPPQPQRPQRAPQHPPQPQYPQDAQSHRLNRMPQHPQPPHPRGASQQRQSPNARPQHPPLQHPSSALPHPPNTMPQQPQPPLPQGDLQQRQSASAMPQHPPPLKPPGAPRQRSRSPMSSPTQPPHTQGTSQQRSRGPMLPHPQVSPPQPAPPQRTPNAITQPQSQHSQATPQPKISNDRREEEAKRPEAMPNSNVRPARQATQGAAAGPYPARTQPLGNERSISEGKTDEQEPRASILQDRRRRAAESQHRLAKRQEQQNRNDCRHEDHDTESCPHRTERHAATEHAEESRSISGPQSMLHVFKARADAAIEASGDSPSFTDRLLIEMVQLLCNMAQDAMPEIERRLAQNQGQNCS